MNQRKRTQKRSGALKRLLLTLLLLMPAACAGTGEVVRVQPADEAIYSGLREADRTRLDEIQKEKTTAGKPSRIENVIAETPSFSVAEYLSRHPGAGDPATQDYRVGGYDVLRISVYEEPDLSRENLRVSADGLISFPLIGRLSVNGLSPSEIARRISDSLAEEQYLLDAHVAVDVLEYNSRKFMVLGAVKAPGSYPLQARERVLDAISRAGGIDLEKSGRQGMIIRTLEGVSGDRRKVSIRIDLPGLLQRGNQTSNLLLADEDLLYIPTADFYYIIGQVEKPGKYPCLDKEITIVEAISTAGGFTSIASRNRTRIVRMEAGREAVIQVKVDAITEKGLKGNDILIHPGDVIVVPESLF